MRRLASIILVSVLPLSLAACESSQDKSARKEEIASKKAKVAQLGLVIPKADPRLKVVGITILRGTDRNAIVVTIKSNAKTALVDVPVALRAYRKGKTEVYTNTAYGTDPTLIQIPIIRPGQTFQWVDDQVIGDFPTSAKVKLGIGKELKSVPADPTLIKVHFFEDPVSGVAVKGKVTNNSPFGQSRLIVFSVVTRSGKIVAAGRSVVEKLLPKGQGKPQVFAVYYVGASPKTGVVTNFVPSTDLTN